MNKKIIGAGLTLAATVTLMLAAGCSTCKEQAEFPRIVCQPEDQLVKAGGMITLSVQARNGPCTYQWLRGGVILEGQTNASLHLENVKIEDAGFYSCDVSKGEEKVPTRTATVRVYITSIDPRTHEDPVTVYCAAVNSGGTIAGCPGTYAGYVNYTKTVSQGWGWAPMTNTTVFTAADGGGRQDTKVTYLGKSLDSSCAQAMVPIPNRPTSLKYRFTIYFPSGVPTTNYPIVLTGFDP